MARCDVSTDSKGRQCVAIEWHDDGREQSREAVRDCNLAWGCVFTGYIPQVSVFKKFLSSPGMHVSRLFPPFIFELLAVAQLVKCKAHCFLLCVCSLPLLYTQSVRMDIISRPVIFRDGLLWMEWAVDRLSRRAINVRICADRRENASRTNAVIRN